MTKKIEIEIIFYSVKNKHYRIMKKKLWIAFNNNVVHSGTDYIEFFGIYKTEKEGRKAILIEIYNFFQQDKELCEEQTWDDFSKK